MNKFIILLIILAAAAASYLYLRPEAWNELRDGSPLSPAPMPIYKWQDSNGQWQVSHRPPPKGTPYETLEYHRDTNVIPPPPHQ